MFDVSTAVVDFASAKCAARGDHHKCALVSKQTPRLVVLVHEGDVGPTNQVYPSLECCWHTEVVNGDSNDNIICGLKFGHKRIRLRQ